MPETGSRVPLLARVGEVLAILGGWALLGLSLLVTFEIVARKLFRFSTQGADEIGGYVLAVTATLGFAYALQHKAHIRIDPVALRFPAAGRAVLDIVAFALLNLFIWLLTWRAFDLLRNSWQLDARAPTPLATPLVVPQTLWVLALVFFGLVALAKLVPAVVRLARGRAEAAIIELDRAALDEELQQEIADAARRARARRER